MADNDAGPSESKKIKIEFKALFSDKELEKLLYESDENIIDDEFHYSDSDDNYGGGDGSSDDENDDDVQQQPCVATVEWTEDSWNMKKINFTKQNELLVIPNGKRPIDYFNILMDESFLDIIVEETNKYAEELFLSPIPSPQSRICRWHDTTAEELRIFFGIFLHMGTISLNRVQAYWKTSRLFNIPFFRSAMSRDRFLLILRCLHFARNPVDGQPTPEDRLFKITPLVYYFNKKMSDIYYPNKDLSVGESMVLWKGRLFFRQDIKNKRHKYGIKLYMLTEPNGIILKFAVYTGLLDDFGDKEHTAKVILHLMEEHLDVGHSVYMDSLYNSHDLSVELLDRETYSTGTLRLDRRNIPVAVKTAILKEGETISRYSNDQVMVGKWREVAYISTEFVNEMVLYRDRKDRKKEKPNPIVQHNKFMAGIDKKGQLMSYYPYERKCLRWYKKLGVHILQMMLTNSYLLFKKYENSKISFYDFRLSVIESLVPEKVTAPINPEFKIHNPIQNALGPNGKILSRRCTLCWNLHKKRKDTRYHCPGCPKKPFLCVGECFLEYHNRK